MRIVAVRYARNTAVSVKSGSRLAERYGDSIRWYARITAVSVKSGSKLAARYGDGNCMPESQQCRSNLDQNWGKYWHTTSRYARITRPAAKSGTKLAEQY